MKPSPLTTSAILVVALCLTATEAEACGEVMLRTLDTMRFHAFVTRHPASILVYSGEGAAHPPALAGKLHDRLEKAGHKVTVARGSDQLAQALAARKYDVVVAYADDLVAVTTQIANMSRESTLIPILNGGADERQMRVRFPHLINDDLNELLKTIEQSVKAQDL
jgi:ABC-type nitrate/sulfonate/bicarbonate transport system substrate-binding protein